MDYGRGLEIGGYRSVLKARMSVIDLEEKDCDLSDIEEDLESDGDTNSEICETGNGNV